MLSIYVYIHIHKYVCIYHTYIYIAHDVDRGRYGTCICMYVLTHTHPQGLMRLTRLRADSRGTPTARGRQCRMS